MRITVDFVLKLLGDGMDADQITTAYPELEKEDVYQAAKYAAWLASVSRENVHELLVFAVGAEREAAYAFSLAQEHQANLTLLNVVRNAVDYNNRMEFSQTSIRVPVP